MVRRRPPLKTEAFAAKSILFLTGIDICGFIYAIAHIRNHKNLGKTGDIVMRNTGQKRTSEDVAALMHRRDDLLKGMAACGDWIRGSLVQTTRPGTKALTLKETEGEADAVFRYLSRSVNGRNRITYVKEEEAAAIARAIAEFDRASALMREISEVNLGILKAGGILRGSKQNIGRRRA
jgi:hypothetical protein